MRTLFSMLSRYMLAPSNGKVASLFKLPTSATLLDYLFFSIWEWEVGIKLRAFKNLNPRHTKMTCLQFINTHDRALLVSGTGKSLRAPRDVTPR